MYLSKLTLNLRSKDARRDLADRYELHRTVMSAFPQTLNAEERVLYRVEEWERQPHATLLVQSQDVPSWQAVEQLQGGDYLLDEPNMRPVKAIAQTGQRLQFRLQANPTFKRDGKRHAIYKEEDLLLWLGRKAEQHGFSIDPLGIKVVKIGKKYGKGNQQVWHAVQFDGVLKIENHAVFLEALVSGIGSAKAFGFGLLSVPYARV